MFNTILIPIDLAHTDKLEKALAVGAGLANHYDAEVYLVGVTTSAPGVVAHNPDEYAEKLKAFADQQSKILGIKLMSVALTSPDPAVDLDDHLATAAEQLGADLVVMASHVPGVGDYVFSSNAGFLASHSSLSVFVVR